MGDAKRRKLSHGAASSSEKSQKAQSEAPARDSPSPQPQTQDHSTEEESATLDVPSASEEAPAAPKTFAELVRLYRKGNLHVYSNHSLGHCRVALRGMRGPQLQTPNPDPREVNPRRPPEPRHHRPGRDWKWKDGRLCAAYATSPTRKAPTVVRPGSGADS
jgi:hypothetical protein